MDDGDLAILRPGEVALVLACSAAKVRQLLTEGELHFHRLGKVGHRRIEASSLRDYLRRTGISDARLNAYLRLRKSLQPKITHASHR